MGFNFRLTNLQAALGLAQIERIHHIVARKRSVGEEYTRRLKRLRGLQLPVDERWARSVYWMYSIVVGPEYPLSRDELMTHLRERGIETRTFFCPLSMQPFLQRQPGFRPISCPVAEALWTTGMYLPSSITLSDETIESIADEVRAAAAS
jgi:perosamine synthetase